MEIIEKKVEHPVDYILDAGKHIILCEYNYSEGHREGCLELMDKATKTIHRVFRTAGTFCAAYKNNKIYAANCDSVCIYNIEGLVKRVERGCISTYIELGTYVIVADVEGSISFFDYELNLLRRVKVSNDSLWVAKMIDNKVYIGGEDGYAYVYSFEDDKINKIGEKRYSIINFLKDENKLYITSYDDNVEIFNIETLEKIDVIKKTGSIWNIIKHNEKYYCACMYEGLKVFSQDWELIEHQPTKSICYGLCISEEYIYWSSFYESCIFYKQLTNENII